jgi:hypothetical protein
MAPIHRGGLPGISLAPWASDDASVSPRSEGWSQASRQASPRVRSVAGGATTLEATVRNLVGRRVFVDRVTGSKEVRAEPFVAQARSTG